MSDDQSLRKTAKVPVQGCAGKTRKGSLCLNKVVPGTNYCHLKAHCPKGKWSTRFWAWIENNRFKSSYSLLGFVLAVSIGTPLAITAFCRYNSDKAKNATVGILSSDKKVIFDSNSKVFPELEIGDSGTGFTQVGAMGTPIFRFFDDNKLTIVADKEGNAKVSITLMDKTGDIVAEIVENEWKVKKEKIWDRNYSKDAFEVKDGSGDVVLQVKIVGNKVQLQAKLWFSSGEGIAIGKAFNGQKWGGLIESASSTGFSLKFQPIFKYPSELHLGEMVD